jgi:hypothetical protein
MPTRGTTVPSHELAKNASVPGTMLYLASGELFHAGATDWLDASRSAAATLYLSTHAFLI